MVSNVAKTRFLSRSQRSSNAFAVSKESGAFDMSLELNRTHYSSKAKFSVAIHALGHDAELDSLENEVSVGRIRLGVGKSATKLSKTCTRAFCASDQGESRFSTHIWAHSVGESRFSLRDAFLLSDDQNNLSRQKAIFN